MPATRIGVARYRHALLLHAATKRACIAAHPAPASECSAADSNECPLTEEQLDCIAERGGPPSPKDAVGEDSQNNNRGGYNAGVAE